LFIAFSRAEIPIEVAADSYSLVTPNKHALDIYKEARDKIQRADGAHCYRRSLQRYMSLEVAANCGMNIRAAASDVYE
jgi:hypothetical protein